MIQRLKFDKEYSTQWNDERDYLAENGIMYEFVKEINGVSTYKYKKNTRLFELLLDFYKQLEK